ncbi:hypothetical protein N9W31_04400 [Litoricolaceae bacterium]|nr:hypothetical protein [Litorivicinaceae bacterium]MDB2412654.1 hypothetical protein [Litorivicinaceae bacterium]MDC1075352.1 hypothetical protein [Litorivicinus sp.]
MKIKFWEQTFTRVIQSTESDYHRGLMQAFPGCVSIGDPIRIDWQNVIVEIRLRHLPDFSVGLVVLPMLEATWEFVEGQENRQRELLAKADLSMQRGLG